MTHNQSECKGSNIIVVEGKPSIAPNQCFLILKHPHG